MCCRPCRRGVSLVGAAMSALYSGIAAAASAAAAAAGGRRASFAPRPGSDAERIYSAASSIGTIMFAFGGHSVLLEIQARSGISMRGGGVKMLHYEVLACA